MKVELIVKTKIEESLPKVIDFNYEELKASLTAKLDKYKNLVVVESEIQIAKKDRANLSKLRKTINDKKKEVKKLCLAPYTDFEDKCKELMHMVDSPITAIDGQIKVFETKELAEKKAEINAYYSEIALELKDVLHVNRVISPKWENIAETVKKIKSNMKDAIEKVRSDLAVIESLASEHVLNIKDKYLETLDLSVAMQEKTRLEDLAESLKKAEEEKAEIKKKEDEAKAEVAKKVEPIKEPSKQVVEQETISEATPEQTPTVYNLSVKLINTTPEFRNEMGQLCLKYGIKSESLQED